MQRAQEAIILIAIVAAPVGNAEAPIGDAGVAQARSSAALPYLGEAGDMSPAAERRLGDSIVRALYRDPDYIDDPVITEYVQGIWQPLLVAARLRGDLPAELDEHFAWQILTGKDRTVNAFALPGGYMGLHMGLVAVVTSRDELASVMAHELSHITQRHISRIMTGQSARAPWMIGAMILGVLAASKSVDAANAIVVGGQAAAAQSQLNFSRDMEREADRVGFGVSTQAGFAPEGFVSMFAKLQQASRLNDTGGFPYLRSHPLTTERMADMQARIPQSTGKAVAPVIAMVLEHAMVSARARVLSHPAVDDLRAWAADAEPAATDGQSLGQVAGALYGATFAAIKLRDFDRALPLWQRLAALVSRDPAASRLAGLLGVELWVAQGDGAGAASLLPAPVGALQRPEVVLLAQAALAAGSHQSAGNAPTPTPPLPTSPSKRAPALAFAAQQLQTWVAGHPQDALVWQVLATVYAAQGRTLGAIRAQGEVNMAQLDYAAAAARFKSAQDLARSSGAQYDHIEASIIDTRLREASSLAREQALER
jgi:predicted Zn-dependent protease